jgi:hypothetical protein
VGDHTVQQRIRTTSSGVDFWTEIVTSRGIALHQYSPVDGTPLSHGCIRLDHDTAVKIWCGSRDLSGSRRPHTTVRVHGLARPRCDHPTLQQEWRGDFEEAGQRPPDGEQFDARTAHHIEITRRELRSALGVDQPELERRVEALRGATHDFGTTGSDLAAVEQAIPHCVPTETVEEHRLGGATPTPAAGTPRGFIADASFGRLLAPFERAYRRSTDLASAQAVVRAHARGLWSAATARARGSSPDTDDRPLYWTRLAMEQTLRETMPAWLDRLNPDAHRRTLEGLLTLFEGGSRGMDTASFGDRDRVKRIVISGFDPFGLDTEIRMGNPSGAAVLALDGQLISSGTTSGHLEGAIFPVRYPDFDAGTIERFFGPYLTGRHPADLIMTISRGISTDTELEEFAGRRRSTPLPENLGLLGGGTHTAPVEPPGLGPGAEFLPTTVPPTTLGAMRGSLGRTGALSTETDVTGLPPGSPSETSASGGTAISGGWTAVTGSGGGYLSNEIFYRTVRLVREHADPVPMIHLHTPILTVSGTGAGDAHFTAARDQMVQTVRDVLVAALPTL